MLLQISTQPSLFALRLIGAVALAGGVTTLLFMALDARATRTPSWLAAGVAGGTVVATSTLFVHPVIAPVVELVAAVIAFAIPLVVCLGVIHQIVRTGIGS